MVADVGSRSWVLGIAGGSGAGKTTLAKGILNSLSENKAVLIQHDWYYRDLRCIPLDERILVNFDHPAALETDLLRHHLQSLLKGESITAPCYDFQTHTRQPTTRQIHPAPLILLEGNLILADPGIRSLIDLSVFVDASDDVRMKRRLERDTQERGRSIESVIFQYNATVQPMYELYVEPSRKIADLVISGLDDVNQSIRKVLKLMADSLTLE